MIEWFSTKLFSDFERKPAEDSKIQRYLNLTLEKSNDFDEINYSFSLNHLSSREFCNVYNQKYMNFF